jgi:hypothetical protein
MLLLWERAGLRSGSGRWVGFGLAVSGFEFRVWIFGVWGLGFGSQDRLQTDVLHCILGFRQWADQVASRQAVSSKHAALLYSTGMCVCVCVCVCLCVFIFTHSTHSLTYLNTSQHARAHTHTHKPHHSSGATASGTAMVDEEHARSQSKAGGLH